jgi:hypothetical protein
MGPIDMGGPPMPPPIQPEQESTDNQSAQPRTQEPYAPIVELRIADTQPVETRSIPANTNFADDEEVKRLCQTELWGIVTRIKSGRLTLEDEWLATQRLRTMQHDGNQKYRGRSNVYMPTYATAHDTIMSQLSRGLFPSDDYMDVEAENIDQEPIADAVKTKIRYEFECNAKLKINIKPAISQYIDHGNGVVKYWHDTGAQFKGRKTVDKGFAFKQTKPRGFTVSARSIFNVLVYPENASDEKEVLLTAEYITMSRQYALTMAET